MKTVKVHEAKTHLSRLLAEVEAGAEIVIARGDRAIAKLVAMPPDDLAEIAEKRRRAFGSLKGMFSEADIEELSKPLPDDILDMMLNGPIFPEDKP
jgi:antitoxin (DNA-binding transcriptional repressor) of toxin-antitoxin stability system